MQWLNRNFGLILFLAACIVAPLVIHRAIVGFPSAPYAVISTLEFFPSPPDRFYSVEAKRWYWLVYQPEIDLYGRIFPSHLASQISLEVNEALNPGPFEPDPRGGFYPKGLLLSPYANAIVARGPRGSHNGLQVFYLPNRPQPQTPPPVPRTVSLHLTPDTALITYTAAFAGQNLATPDFEDVQSGVLSDTLFLKRVFYPDRAGFTGEEFSALATHPSVRTGIILVTLTGTLAGPKYKPDLIARLLDLTPSSGGVITAPITITLSLDRLALVAPPRPWPTTWHEGNLQWVDPATPIKLNYEPQAGIGFGFPLLRHLRTELQAAIDQLNRASVIFNVTIRNLAPLIPFFFAWLVTSLNRASAQNRLPRQNLLRGLVSEIRRLPAHLFSALNNPGTGEIANSKWYLLLILAAGMWLVPVATYLASPQVSMYPREAYFWASALPYCLLLPLFYYFGVRETSSNHFAWLKWVAFGLGPFVLAGGLLFFEGYLFGPALWTLLMGLPILVIMVWLACEMYRSDQFRRLIWYWPRGSILALGLLILAWPVTASLPDFNPGLGWQPEHWMQLYLIVGFLCLPYAALIWLLPALSSLHTDSPGPDYDRRASRHGRLIFAIFIVGFSGGWGILPEWAIVVSALVAAFWVYPFLIERRTEWGFLKSAYVREALHARPVNVANLRETRPAPELWGDHNVRRAIYRFGPLSLPIGNAWLACAHSLKLSTLLFLAYLPFILIRADQLLSTAFPLLQVLGVLVLPFFARWFLAAFLLGYFFPLIRGANGLKKGLWLAIGIIVSTLPGYLLRLIDPAGDPFAVLWDIAQVLFFLSILGIWTFDLNTARRYGIGWRELMLERGLVFVVSSLTTLTAALAGVVGSIITGRVETIVTSALDLILRNVPSNLGQ